MQVLSAELLLPESQRSSQAFRICSRPAIVPCLQLASEVRYPIRNVFAYGYAEYATDLGSGPEVPGNPNDYYRRPGSALSYGGGVEWCDVKLEYQKDTQKKRGAILLRYGNRF